jgi:hypothetical protein
MLTVASLNLAAGIENRLAEIVGGGRGQTKD